MSDDTPGRGDQLPGVRATESTFPRPLVGSLRPDAHSGTGIQFYDIGRFLGYPMAEGGSCGDPEAGPGLIVSLEHRFARRDLGPERTVVSGGDPIPSNSAMNDRRRPSATSRPSTRTDRTREPAGLRVGRSAAFLSCPVDEREER